MLSSWPLNATADGSIHRWAWRALLRIHRAGDCLVMRGLAAEAAQRRKRLHATRIITAVEENLRSQSKLSEELMSRPALVCAVRSIGKTIDFAVQEAIETRRLLYVLFVREVLALTEADGQRPWQDDDEARRIFAYARQKAAGHPVMPCYTVSDALPETIVEVAATIRAAQLVLGAQPARAGFIAARPDRAPRGKSSA